MTPVHAFQDPNRRHAAVVNRVRWDNLAIMLAALVAMIAVITWIVVAPDTTTATSPSASPKKAPALGTVVSGDQATEDEAAQAQEAIDRVAEARALIKQGRWDAAAEQLDAVPADLREQANVPQAQLELQSVKDRHDSIVAALTTSLATENWSKASAQLNALLLIAPLSDELLATQDRVDAAVIAMREQAKEQARTAATSAAKAVPAAAKDAANATTTKRPGQGASKKPGGTTVDSAEAIAAAVVAQGGISEADLNDALAAL